MLYFFRILVYNGGENTTKHRKADTDMKVMGIDYGDARTGVAISDLLCSIVGQTTVVPSRNQTKLMDQLMTLIRENQVGEIVVGLPKNMDGSEGPRAELYRAFAEKIQQQTTLKPALWDERRTTVDAHRILFESGKNAKKRKKTVDAVAASLILEGYLTFRRTRG